MNNVKPLSSYFDKHMDGYVLDKHVQSRYLLKPSFLAWPSLCTCHVVDQTWNRHICFYFGNKT